MRTRFHPLQSANARQLASLSLGSALLLAGMAPGCSSQTDDDDATAAVTPTPEVTATPATPTPVPFSWVDELTGLMDFWTNSNLDTEHGGYYTFVGRAGNVTSETKWTRMVSREVYGYVRAFQVTGDLTLLDHAKSGVDFLVAYALDTDAGGFWQRLNADGSVQEPDERTMFDQAYALVGLTAYVEATRDPAIQAIVENTYGQLDATAWDPSLGGYFKELNADMSVKDDDKDFNAQVDTATAYLFNLYAVTGNSGYLSRLDQIGLNIVDHMLHPKNADGSTDETGWIGENFDKDWTYDPDNSGFGDGTLCGHNLKVVWTLLRLYNLKGTSLYFSEAETLLDFVLDTCRDPEYGGIYDVVDRQTNALVYGDQKAWWQQEEGMFALQMMAALTGKSYYQNLALETRDFYLTYFIDPLYGEVFNTVAGNGTPKDTTKGNEWKSAYHSTETAYFSYLYDAFFTSLTPVTLYYHFDATDADRTLRLAPAEVPYGTYAVDDPAYLDGVAVPLATPSTLVIPAGSSGTLAVTYRPDGA